MVIGFAQGQSNSNIFDQLIRTLIDILAKDAGMPTQLLDRYKRFLE